MGGMDFMSSVVRNGIGGVNAGGTYEDVVPGRGQQLAINDSLTYQYLTRSPEHAKSYVEAGYLATNYFTTNKGFKRANYTLTPLGRDKYNGSAMVKEWSISEEARKKQEKADRLVAKAELVNSFIPILSA